MSKDEIGLGDGAKDELIRRFRSRGAKTPAVEAYGNAESAARRYQSLPEAFYRFDRFPNYELMALQKSAAQQFAIDNPFFRVHEGAAGAKTVIGARQYDNFSSYNYLGLSHHPRVDAAAKAAIDRYGTSASASRLVAGERPVQRDLEQALAEWIGVEDCIVFVSGHATNVSTIGSLFGPKDLILHDSLIHASVLDGIKLSGATRRSFPHNDHAAAEALLGQLRGQFERVLVVIESLYSMDGDCPDLVRFVELKTRHRAFLMVDEAHGLGVLGTTGHGACEQYGVLPEAVDIHMGTLSKTLAGCGGFIAGSQALVEQLRYYASGFVYSVGMPPPMAAASLEALAILREEPERVTRLQARGRYFLETARAAGIDTGLSQGFAVVPAIVGSSMKAVNLSNALFAEGINVQPIIYPAVGESAARLRFFLSSEHETASFDRVIEAIARLS
ncbi:aminotransferase class I/II-fold pyridoxal phosphate-dependent enzyme [Zavarzinia sp.]|uniref:aminotransferase class I/II-fold pyridoxal phosphate-dependent enzyme n=1 Tax=Zavarzinia sp. TaxID=2027920 RepID=UPI0035669400